MNVVVTITQSHRVALPYIFIRHVLPRLRACFPGEIEVVLIQHRVDASGGGTTLESLRAAGAAEKLARVRTWTEEGRFVGATVVGHEIVHRPYPLIPSVHLGVRAALERRADFHLWLQDDALVFDEEIAHWPERLAGHEVGVYAPTPQILHPAFLVTRPAFDRRIIGPLENYAAWTWGRTPLETFLRRNLRTRRAYLPRHYAVRSHPREYPYTGIRYVVTAVKKIAPGAVPLLDLDFGPGAQDLRFPTPEERAAHAAREGRGLENRLWLLRQRLSGDAPPAASRGPARPTQWREDAKQ